MPETSGESASRGQSRSPPPQDKIKLPEEPRCSPPPPLAPPPPPPSPPPPPRVPPSPPPPPQSRDGESPSASGSQCWSSVDDMRRKQQRPSVLRQVLQTSSTSHHENSEARSVCEKEVDTGHLSLSPSPPMGSFLRQSYHLLPSRTVGPNQSSLGARLHDGVSDGASALFVSGFCRWPGCDAIFNDFPSFLKHLHSEHSQCDRSLAQWRVQQDIVQYMESQLLLEKQKLSAMQLHLRLSEHKYTDLKVASEWPYSLPVFLPQPQVSDGERMQQWCFRQLEHLSENGYRAAASANLLSDVIPSIEFYKYKNIRPPYTYAYLIRSSIVESPEKQRTLNEIYNWFTTMFCYFRHNTATWKNAVRHNLSLHKCFVRVEGGKGAVWTVDENEYQRRKGQKYHRDCPIKWLTSYSQYYGPEDS